MTLDPIVSLSVALAEAPGTCAFLLGAGVSRDAGIPTGAEIMRDGLRRLHQLETAATEPADDETLDAWLEETDREHITYSELLELITPDPAVRREYLASFFEGREPGPTHEALARMAERGLVRVFVTTNFDRLLEHALHARGVEPVVIASDADLGAAQPREHAGCVVLKPHGDYLRETIRNTPEELTELEAGLTAELGEIFSRYGVVVLGYSGGDEAIARALRARRSRFGVWWVARGDLGPSASELVESVHGRVVRRETAAVFLADLERRLAVFAEHPSGLTPAATHDGLLNLLRNDDRVGVDEMLRQERHEYETAVQRVSADALSRHGSVTADALSEVWAALRPVLERRLASLIPLALHDEARFRAEISHIARALERRPRRSGITLWLELAEWSATWLGYVCGALLVRLDRLEVLAPLLETTWVSQHGTAEPLVWLPGDFGHHLGEALMDPPGGGSRWLAPGWEFLTRRSLESADWLQQRYQELFGEEEPRSSMGKFDLLLCIRYGVIDHRAVAFFTLGGEGPVDLARRLHQDAGQRERVASVVGLSMEDFDAKAPQLITDAGGFRESFYDPRSVARALESGSAI